MGFSLTISEGKDRGREYTFSQPEVCIGRTAENDLVLTEAGVSRRHVKIREEGGQYFVEDLGSANGTKVNGEAVTENQLSDGDSIQVGPVVFAFAAIPDAGENSTRIFDPAELERKMAATKKAKEAAAGQAGAQKRAVTAMAPAIARASSSGRGVSGPRASGNRALAQAPAPASKPGALAKKAPAPVPQKSASERARERRAANTPIARFKLWWSGASKGARAGVGLGGLVVVGGLIFAVARGMGGGGPAITGIGDDSKKLFDIGSEPTDDTWGYGMDGVRNQTQDKAQFEFLFPVTAKKAIATLHFSSAGVQKAEWVDVAVNTIHVGFVEPTFGDNVKDQEINIPTKYLQPNKKNRVVFDHLRNPPGHEPWMIAKVWVEVQQLPEDTAEHLKARAQEAITNGDRAWEYRQVGADNTFKAWKAYKQARLYLEALDEHIDELDVVRQKIKDATRELDAICAKYMLKGQAAEKQGKEGEAINIYKGALSFFPEKDHSCYQQLHEKLQNLE